jgi:hypothetical protein
MRIFSAILCLVAGFCLAAPTGSGPVFNDLEGTPCRPLDAGDKMASVLIFFWHDCTISNGYVPELNRICASHPGFAFYIVQVDPELTPAAAKKHAREYDLHMPVLLDPRHRLVKLAKATVTPEAVVLGKNETVLYRGRIDDIYAAPGKKRATPTQHDLRDALDAIASGHQVKKNETTAIGCLIQ